MANYVLAPEEQVIFELNIEAPSKGDDGVVSIAQNLLKTFLPVCQKKTAAILVFTNMRILITNRESCCGDKNKFFWTFPRTALNGDNSFSMIAGGCSCCDTYTFNLGLDLRTTTSISFGTPDVRSVEQAQALIAKIFQLSQNN